MPTEKEFLAKKAELDLKQDKLTAGDNITINSNTNVISATYPDVTGATSQSAGAHGLVPAPAAGDESKFLKGDGTWDTVSAGSASLAGLTDVDLNNPTDGQALVYDATNQEWVNGEAGNADYVELTQQEYDALTPAQQMNGTLYFITDGGGGSGGGGDTNVYGAFIDTNRIIQAEISVGSSDTYTATQDCMVVILLPIGNHNTYVYIDGVKVINMSGMASTYYDYTTIPLKEGQEMTFDFGSTNGYITVYGLTFGTQNIFTPQIYSTEERCVGVWIDNKPLYAKSYNFGALPNNTSKTISSGLTGVNVVKIGGTATNASGFTTTIPHPEIGGNADVQIDFLATNEIRIKTNSDYSGFTGYVTLLYTKTTDIAGSGSFNTLGVPMVHYSTDEQVVGTWIDGKTIYQKSIAFDNTSSNNLSVDVVGLSIDTLVEMKIWNKNTGYQVNSYYNTADDQVHAYYDETGYVHIRRGTAFAGTGYVTLQYTKTTD